MSLILARLDLTQILCDVDAFIASLSGSVNELSLDCRAMAHRKGISLG
jgi:hypothetical protein